MAVMTRNWTVGVDAGGTWVRVLAADGRGRRLIIRRPASQDLRAPLGAVWRRWRPGRPRGGAWAPARVRSGWGARVGPGAAAARAAAGSARGDSARCSATAALLLRSA